MTKYYDYTEAEPTVEVIEAKPVVEVTEAAPAVEEGSHGWCTIL